MVSAVKHQGERLYKIARQGIEVERTARHVRIDELRILKFRLPDVEFMMSCSKGTYVRQLAEDVGEVFRLWGVYFSNRAHQGGAI